MKNYEIAKNKLFEEIKNQEARNKSFSDATRFIFGMISGIRLTGFLTDEELCELKDECEDELMARF